MKLLAALRISIQQTFSCCLLAASAILAGCGPNVLEARNAEIVNGKIYKQGANTGFTGKVTNVPHTKILLEQEGFSTFSKTLQQVPGTGRTLDRLVLSMSVCDLQVEEGVPDGKVSCALPQSQIQRYQMEFKDGKLHGPVTVYDVTEENNIAATASFADGLLDGKEIFSVKTKKLIRRVHWDEGRPEGEEEGFHEETGRKNLSIRYADGKFDGPYIRYAADGERVIYRAHLSARLLDGVEEEFDAETGRPLRYVEWAKGKRNGKLKQWDAEGNLSAHAVYEDGRDVTPKQGIEANANAASASDVQACVDLWVVASRKERGDDAIVSTDQLGEWESFCRTGRRPG